MHTNDLATIDADGYCRVVGRSWNMVIRDGKSIYPRKAEAFLDAHPAIPDVQVLGVQDPRFGEALCAWVCVGGGATADEADI